MAFHAERNRRVQVEEELNTRKHGNASLQAHAQSQAEVGWFLRTTQPNGRLWHCADGFEQALESKLEHARKHVMHLEIKMTQEQQARAEMEETLATMAQEDRYALTGDLSFDCNLTLGCVCVCVIQASSPASRAEG